MRDGHVFILHMSWHFSDGFWCAQEQETTKDDVDDGLACTPLAAKAAQRRVQRQRYVVDMNYRENTMSMCV